MGLAAGGNAAGSGCTRSARVRPACRRSHRHRLGLRQLPGAHAATSRLLYTMARDRQLPPFLSKVHAEHGVPVSPTLLVAATRWHWGSTWPLATTGSPC